MHGCGYSVHIILKWLKETRKKNKRRKEYKKKKRAGRINGRKEHQSCTIEKLSKEVVVLDDEKERQDWELKFKHLER